MKITEEKVKRKEKSQYLHSINTLPVLFSLICIADCFVLDCLAKILKLPAHLSLLDKLKQVGGFYFLLCNILHPLV